MRCMTIELYLHSIFGKLLTPVRATATVLAYCIVAIDQESHARYPGEVELFLFRNTTGATIECQAWRSI